MNEQIICPLEPDAPGRDNRREELPLAAAVARYGELTAAYERAVQNNAVDVEKLYTAEAAELLAAIQATLERVLPFTGTCPSEFTPPAAEGQPQITYRCNGTPGHDVDQRSMHGSGVTSWGANADDAHHPGEATAIRVSEKLRLMKEAIELACDQRNAVIAAYGELSQALARVRELEDTWRGVRLLNGVFIADSLERVRSDIPGWARPQTSNGPDAEAQDGGMGGLNPTTGSES